MDPSTISHFSVAPNLMLWLQSWLAGTKSLLLHPLRSLLTMLGIFIGVASVIWMLAFADGISREAQRQIESLGADTIIVRTVKPPNDKLAGSMATQYGLKRSEYDKLIATVPTIKSALPIREMSRQFTFRDRSLDGRLVGCTEEYAEVNRLRIRDGQFISDLNNIKRDNVCVLAAKVAEKLFPYEQAVGKRVYVPEHTDYYEVIGVLYHRNASAAIGGSLSSQDFSNDVYIPIRTLQQRIGDTIVSRRSGSFQVEVLELNQITLKLTSKDVVRSTAAMVENLLMPAHEEMSDLAVVVPLELLEQARTQRLMWLLIGILIAAISLVVGGIGIMNIMLATVTERTREIGVRRALGAKRRDIIHQFLIETTVLSVCGGITGIIAGWLLLPLVSIVRSLAFSYAPEFMESLPEVLRNVTPSLVPMSVPLAFGIAVAVGIISGIYPAIRAAKMSPIDALRHE